MTIESALLRFFILYLAFQGVLGFLGSLLSIDANFTGIAAILGSLYCASFSFNKQNGRLFSVEEKKRFLIGVVLIYVSFQATLGLAYLAYGLEIGADIALGVIVPMVLIWVVVIASSKMFLDYIQKQLLASGNLGNSINENISNETPRTKLWEKIVARSLLIICVLLMILIIPASVLKILAT